MPFDLDALRTELQTDPHNLGYAGHTPAEATALLNEPGLSREFAPRDAVDAALFAAQVSLADWGALTDAQRAYLAAMAAVGTIYPTPTVIGNIQTLWPDSGNPTRQRLAVLLVRPVSRAEVLFGEAVSEYFVILAGQEAS